MKVLFATFFLLIFSFQVLPVKELGKILFKGTMTEERHEAGGGCSDDLLNLKKENDPYTYHGNELSCYLLVLTGKGCTATSPEHITHQFTAEIITPPPDIA